MDRKEKAAMAPARIKAESLKKIISDGQEVAILDPREEGAFGENHLLLAVNVPLSKLELRIEDLVPRKTTRIVLTDGGDGLAERAAARLNELGYDMVSILDGGVPAWSAAEVTDILLDQLAKENVTFASNDRLRLHGMNGHQIHRMLARLTDYVETRSEMPSHYSEYVQPKGKHGYEVEHVWANHPERHKDEFDHPSDFEEYRNRIGCLLLLPKSFNASYGDLPYDKKRDHYLEHNLLAKSLHENAYDHNPGFLRFVKESGLPLKAHPAFKKADLDARQELYRQLAEEIWNPERLRRELV